MTLIPGTRLGPYEILSPLGSGGMGEVYRAADTNLKRQVAIKVLPVSVAGDSDRLARFQREAEVLAALNHPHMFAERNGVVSPDGHWLAYEANDSGHFEIHVRPFPDVNGGHWSVSTAGGTKPLWGPNSQELFYMSPTGALMRVGMQSGPSSATTPTLLVKEGYLIDFPMDRTYDMAKDGAAVPQDQRGRQRGPRRCPPRASSSSLTGPRN